MNRAITTTVSTNLSGYMLMLPLTLCFSVDALILARAATLPQTAKHPPVLLVHGTADPIVPFSSLGAHCGG